MKVWILALAVTFACSQSEGPVQRMEPVAVNSKPETSTGAASTGPGDPDTRAAAVTAAICSAGGSAGTVPGLEPFGPGLTERLSDLHGELAAGCTGTLVRGEPKSPGGDGRASHHLLLRVGDRNLLGLRLAYDPRRDTFQVLGFWRPTPSL
ncbi:MAG TPA: hypothetical protein VGS22_02710 [Thermoanaerobaculia bacterium]|nr:hypothetical protein [Thermoanaerobaculia bacterium]